MDFDQNVSSRQARVLLGFVLFSFVFVVVVAIITIGQRRHGLGIPRIGLT